MNINAASLYRCPRTLGDLELHVTQKEDEYVLQGYFRNRQGDRFEIEDGVPDFTWPRELSKADADARASYDRLAEDYEKFASIPFRTYQVEESDVRMKITEKLNLTKGDRVLEIGCGDGRGAEYIARGLGDEGEMYLQELSPAFLSHARTRLKPYSDRLHLEFSVANACYLSFPDSVFDAAHHFGGLNTFSDVSRCLKELCRVVKPGGKVVVGDESMGLWLRNTDFGKIMMNSNPLLECPVPFDKIPVAARDVNVEWIMLGAFFLLDFTVGVGEPEADYHIPIPSERGGTHWTRYFGNLEGISDETKKLAHAAREKTGESMHDWLDRVVKLAAKKDLDIE